MARPTTQVVPPAVGPGARTLVDLHTSTWPRLARLGWPVSATMLVRVTMRTVDILMVGMTVGAAGVAALGIGDAAARIMLFTALGLSAGTIATVSQRLGAGDRAGAERAVTQTALLAVAIGVPFTLLGLWGAPHFYALLGADPQVTDLGTTYLRVVILSAVPRTLAIMLTRAYQAAADTWTPMVIRTIGTLVNIGLTVVLVPGLLGAPQLGVLGAAIGTSIGNVVSAVMLVGWLATSNGGISFRRDGLTDWATGRRIVRTGLPQVAERNLVALANIPLNAIVLSFGTVANAGYQVGRRMMLYGLLPALGIAIAGSREVGEHLGAGRPKAADGTARASLAMISIVTGVVAVALFVAARPLASVFLQEPEALRVATDWVRVFAAVTVLRAIFASLRGTLQAADETTPPMIATAVGIGLFTLGFSWVVGIVLGVGLLAVYIGLGLDQLTRAGLLYGWFRRGRWKERAGRFEPDPTDEFAQPTV